MIAWPYIVVVKLAPLDLDEAVPSVELIGLALPKRANANGEAGGFSLGENLRQDRCTDSAALVKRANVQMVEQQAFGVWLDHEEPDALAIDQDVPSLLGHKASQKALARPRRVEAPNALQTLAHGLNPEIGQRLTIAWHRNGELNGTGVHAL
jgi:hypothetical protein